jgi:hypothetical protein
MAQWSRKFNPNRSFASQKLDVSRSPVIRKGSYASRQYRMYSSNLTVSGPTVIHKPVNQAELNASNYRTRWGQVKSFAETPPSLIISSIGETILNTASSAIKRAYDKPEYHTYRTPRNPFENIADLAMGSYKAMKTISQLEDFRRTVLNPPSGGSGIPGDSTGSMTGDDAKFGDVPVRTQSPELLPSKDPFDVSAWIDYTQSQGKGQITNVRMGVNEDGQLYVISADFVPNSALNYTSGYVPYETLYNNMIGMGGSGNLFVPFAFQQPSPYDSDVPYVNPYSSYIYDYLGYERMGTFGFMEGEGD